MTIPVDSNMIKLQFENPMRIVFRQEKSVPFIIPETKYEFKFIIVNSWKLLMNVPTLYSILGMKEFIKTFLKIKTLGRLFYVITNENSLIHYGWAYTGALVKHYYVEKDSYVIGPMLTIPLSRSNGVATYGIMNIINYLTQQNGRIFYIDTSTDNVPCLKAIEKSKFGLPYALIPYKVTSSRAN